MESTSPQLGLTSTLLHFHLPEDTLLPVHPTYLHMLMLSWAELDRRRPKCCPHPFRPQIPSRNRHIRLQRSQYVPVTGGRPCKTGERQYADLY